MMRQLLCNTARKRVLLLIIFIFLVVLFQIYYDSDLIENKELDTTSVSNDDEIFAIKTQGCEIPAAQPPGEMLKEFIRYPNEIKACPSTNYSLLVHNRTHIWLDKDIQILKHYKVPQKRHKNIRCCYSSFYRPDNIPNINAFDIDERVRYNECIYFNNIIQVNDEFVLVVCKYRDHTIYGRFFLFVPLKHNNFDNHIQYIEYHKKRKSISSQYNVLVVGIDNLSRLNFHRTMPETATFLKDRGAVELMGYNKVGDNSFANLVPLLMGYSADEIKKICRASQWTTYDNCPFLWHWYQDAGYYTAFGEDSGVLGTFNYMMRGFTKNPTVYYMHPFIAEAERFGARNIDGNVYLCIHDKYSYQILLDYIHDLTNTLWEKKLFGFFWESTMSHDKIHYPIVMDESYLKLFKNLEDSKYLNNTIIFLLSDHGIRWGNFRETREGFMEERLPLAFVLVPPTFRENYIEAFNNLKYNSRQLTTPFDLHETLLDLIDVKNIREKTTSERATTKQSMKRGISLFLKVPQNRTCKSASISDHWCTCHRRVSVPKTSIEIKNASNYLIEYLNLLLSGYPQCEELSMEEIQYSTKLETDFENDDAGANWDEYTVTVKVKPSGGIFEATIRHDDDDDDDEVWSVIGTVSRLNLYGQESDCVHDPIIKLYCFCDKNKNH